MDLYCIYKFFIEASIAQADYYIEKLKQIDALCFEMLQYGRDNGVRDDLIMFIFRKPVFTIKDVESSLGISYNAARNNVSRLLQSGKLYEDDRKRNKVYRFYDFMDIIR